MRQVKHGLMETNSLSKHGLRFTVRGFLVLAVISLFIIACRDSGSATSPDPNNNSCQQIGALSCITTSASGGLTCCLNPFNANASVGYLCVLGFDRFAGCYSSLSQARGLGACGGTVVRCTF